MGVCSGNSFSLEQPVRGHKRNRMISMRPGGGNVERTTIVP